MKKEEKKVLYRCPYYRELILPDRPICLRTAPFIKCKGRICTHYRSLTKEDKK